MGFELNAHTTLSAIWEAYQKRCVPQEASEVQIRHTKTAFFAGAHAFLVLLLNFKPANADDLTPEFLDREVRRIQDLHQELDRFVREG